MLLQVRDAARYPPRDLPALLARALPPDGPAASLQIPVVNYPLQVCIMLGPSPAASRHLSNQCGSVLSTRYQRMALCDAFVAI